VAVRGDPSAIQSPRLQGLPPDEKRRRSTCWGNRRPEANRWRPLQLYCNAMQGKPQRNVEPTIARRGPGQGGEDPSPTVPIANVSWRRYRQLKGRKLKAAAQGRPNEANRCQSDGLFRGTMSWEFDMGANHDTTANSR
jgi:hypothetical protein